jgi:hypothetical protein
MTENSLAIRIAKYLEEHPQYFSSMQMLAIACCPKEERLKALLAAGYTVDTQHGELILTNALVSTSWRTGGISGGSCWGGEANQPVEGEEKPAWLEEFLEAVAPETSFLKFRRLQSKCKRYDYTNDEYYGNSTDYAFEVITVSDIVETLGA